MANGDRALTAISLTAYNPDLESLVKEKGLEHAIAMMPIDTKTCPYVDVGKNGFTYVFVVGRDGRIAWRGNHGVKEKDYLKAVARALAVTPAPPLGRDLAPALDTARTAYDRSRFAASRKEAAKVARKYSRKSGDRPARIREDAAFLMKRIDARASELVEGMEKALESGDAVAFTGASAALAAEFSGTAAHARAKKLIERAADDTAFAGELKAAAAWLALREKRPVLFPARRDRGSQAFARKLEKFIAANRGKGGAREAAALLERFGT